MTKRIAATGSFILVATAGCGDHSSAESSKPSPVAPRTVEHRISKSVSASVYVLDASKSMGDFRYRCDELEVQLLRERARTAANQELLVYVMALGKGFGSTHQLLADWQSIGGMTWSGDAFESLDERVSRSHQRQRESIQGIAKQCKAKIQQSAGSPVLASILRAAEVLAHQCKVERTCASQRVFVHSDLQEGSSFQPNNRTLDPAIQVNICGYGASLQDLTPGVQERLLGVWRKRLGSGLQPMAPTCPQPTSEES